ncbi:uncharacterized protein [Euphorbia lathyris]|uniref:uncharacterized protein isoform X3 n=1 Tax=Euphorbia lathyris TaxID=212925 RepID=UPI003313A010
MARRLAVWMSFIATIHIYKGIDKSTIVNRHHAQRLMENVGLDIYKATMALRLNCSAVESKLIETTIIMKTMSTSLLEKNAYCFVGLIDNSQFKVLQSKISKFLHQSLMNL